MTRALGRSRGSHSDHIPPAERNRSEASRCGIELHGNSMLMQATIRLEFTREKIALRNTVQARMLLDAQSPNALSERQGLKSTGQGWRGRIGFIGVTLSKVSFGGVESFAARLSCYRWASRWAWPRGRQTREPPPMRRCR